MTTTAIQSIRTRSVIDRPCSCGLLDVVDTILDKGLVIDVFLRVSLVGIEILTIDARIIVASVDTYLQFADAVNRVYLSDTEPKTLPDLVEDIGEGGAKHKTKGVIEAAGSKVKDVFSGGDEDNDDDDDDDDHGSKHKSQQPRKAK